jgi:hypothetical protein
MSSPLHQILAAFQAGSDILMLDGQNLAELPSEIGMLTGLKALSLSNNRLTSLPAEIGQLSNLTELVVDENCLTEITPHIGRLVQLTTLNLAHIRLVTLPKEIGNLANLRHLNIADNRLTELPAEFAQLENLRHFDWDKWKANPRKGLPPRMVSHFIAHGNPWVYPPPDMMNKQVNVIRDYLKANPKPPLHSRTYGG